ncbi:hypothetical protein EB837_18940 [Kluyvera ascorbata]|uniref:Uncharacterized protein n=1 Tax=Kluyvera ascorbata TaxID=51288 RepID=A0A3N2RUT4_9ENTR|nr:hypothetical protein EB837_18940 [Kluyvera ascorbata]
MGIFLYSVETSWPEMCLMALRLSGLRCVVGRIRHLCRHPAQAQRHYLVIRPCASFSAASTV